MFSDVEMHLAYKVGNAHINMFPFPHIYVKDVFPDNYYQQLQESLPDPKAMVPIEQARPVKGYKERFVLELSDKNIGSLPTKVGDFWRGVQGTLVERGNFSNLVFSKFRPFIEQRFEGQSGLEFSAETLLVEDTTNYKLGPHTDAPRKVVTMLFYLPKDDSQSHLGTSIYIPNDPDFRCPGGPHYQRENFSRLHTMPFLPNSMFAFLKTDNSFHGVEQVSDPDCRRWLLLFDIYVKEFARPPQPAAEPIVTPKLKFSF